MKQRTLGTSDLQLTTLGLGTWAMGGGQWEWGWGPQDDKQSIRAINRAIELGINWIDTAAAYGLGHAEELIGRAIKGHRDELVIATKCGLVWEDDGTGSVAGHLKAGSVRNEAISSLRRLDTDVIDLFQIHWPDPDEDVEEAWGAIAELVREGKVRYAGVSNFSMAQIERVQSIHPVASLQSELNMLNTEAQDELLPFCRANGIGVVAYSPLRSGILTNGFDFDKIDGLADGDWRRRDPDFQEPRASINVEFVKRLRTLAAYAGRPIAHLATAWVLAHTAVTSAIVGARRSSQVETNVGAADWELNDDLQRQVESLLVWRRSALDEAGLGFTGSLR